MLQVLLNVTIRIRQSAVGAISLDMLAPLANCRAVIAHTPPSPNNASTAAAHALGGGVTPS